jgi:hypothetical protein
VTLTAVVLFNLGEPEETMSESIPSSNENIVPLPTATATDPPPTQNITTTRGTITVPGTAYLDGRDSEANDPSTVMEINIWESPGPDRGIFLCFLEHGTEVRITDFEFVSEEDRYYFFAESGTCNGWLPESFISPSYQEPIGDEIYLRGSDE